MEQLTLNEYNNLLNKLLAKFKTDVFSWEDAETLMKIPSNFEVDWEDFFFEIANHRWNQQKEKKIIKIYTPGLHFPALSLTGDQCALSCDHCDSSRLWAQREPDGRAEAGCYRGDGK